LALAIRSANPSVAAAGPGARIRPKWLFGQENASLRVKTILYCPDLCLSAFAAAKLIRRALAVSFLEMRGPLPLRQKRFTNNNHARN
jgi:hypothetical protein